MVIPENEQVVAEREYTSRIKNHLDPSGFVLFAK